VNKIKYSLALILVLLLVSVNPLGLKAYKIRTVVIDAGHGGHDSGCLGKAAKEKDVALQLAMKVGSLIEQSHKDVKVIYTRKDDRFLELHQRASVANKNNADLFISIHLNSAKPHAHGTETYTQGLHVTSANLEVSKRENASVLLESDYAVNYDGFDPKDPTTHIIFELFQSAYRNQSLKFAEKVEKNFETHAGRFSRGVKQAGFLVLYRTTMPAVLIEAGFLTNPNEENYLTSSIGQQKLSESIYNAFKAYKTEIDKGG
jgi:N-acetylmuramoyl-L-alanine amidase